MTEAPDVSPDTPEDDEVDADGGVEGRLPAEAEADDVRTGDARVDAVLESLEASTSDHWRSTPPCSSRPTSGSVRPWTPTAARVPPGPAVRLSPVPCRDACGWTRSWSAGDWPARGTTPPS